MDLAADLCPEYFFMAVAVPTTEVEVLQQSAPDRFEMAVTCAIVLLVVVEVVISGISSDEVVCEVGPLVLPLIDSIISTV